MEPNGKLLCDKLEGLEDQIKYTMAMKLGATMEVAGLAGEQ